jgi:hypothetical protein
MVLKYGGTLRAMPYTKQCEKGRMMATNLPSRESCTYVRVDTGRTGGA